MKLAVIASLVIFTGCSGSSSLVTSSPSGWFYVYGLNGATLMWCDASDQSRPTCVSPYRDRTNGNSSKLKCEGLDPKRFNCEP